MSRSSEKGRKGELAITSVLSIIGLHEKGIEVVRASTTNTPERGVDVALECPHNLSNKLDEIVEHGRSDIGLANSKIDVRVQVKNHAGPITKSVAQGFVDEIEKNQHFSEHWGVGGTRLTKGAQEVLAMANLSAPVKWYTGPDVVKIQSHYPPLPFTSIDGVRDEDDE